jgi:hypothetical protein
MLATNIRQEQAICSTFQIKNVLLSLEHEAYINRGLQVDYKVINCKCLMNVRQPARHISQVS